MRSSPSLLCDEADRRALLSTLVDYLRIDTTNPPGYTDQAVAYLAALLRGEGIEVTTKEPFARKPMLIARLPGRRAGQGLIFLSHSDVVGVESGWTVAPFGGEVKDGHVFGRGALDMKGMAVMQLWAMILLRRAGVALEQDLVAIVVPDEEQGGFQGAEWLTEHHPELCRQRWLLNEGGMGVRLADSDREVLLCAIGEKGPLWLEVEARGTAGHSAIPHRDNAAEILIAGLERLLGTKRVAQIGPSQRRLMHLLAVDEDCPLDEVPNRLYLRPQLSDTVAVTVVSGGIKQNVIPDRASAILDCRLLPGKTPERFMAEVEERLADARIKVRIQVARAASASADDSSFIELLRRSMATRFGNATFVPYCAPYFTDSMFFRRLGVACYGLMPIMVSEADMGRIHGADERLSVENLVRGTEILIDVALAACG